jgi:hypothetical protein
MEEVLKAFYPVLDEVKALDALKPFLVVEQSAGKPDPHLLKETEVDDLIGSLQASFKHVMTDLARRLVMNELPGPVHCPSLLFLLNYSS